MEMFIFVSDEIALWEIPLLPTSLLLCFLLVPIFVLLPKPYVISPKYTNLYGPRSLTLFYLYYVSQVKVKQSHYRPGQSYRVQGVWGSHISRQSAHEGGKVVSPTHWPPLPPRNYSWYSFLLDAESTPGPYCGRKDYSNEKLQWQSEIEPATFRLVAQCLNQLRHLAPILLLSVNA
jgi:hypothetical protein